MGIDVSVVVTTYNGEKYIEEQLASLIAQTRKADEVLILDDCSTDKTLSIVKDFIENHDLKHWQLIQNEENMGWQNSFAKGFDLCQGTFIFPCDQDDIWMETKLEEMTKILQDNEDINLLVANYVFMKEAKNGEISYEPAKEDIGSVQKIEFSERFFYIGEPGCVFAFRKSFWEQIRKYNFENNPHDTFLWRASAITNHLYKYNKNVIYWRRHESAQTYTRLSSKEKILEYFSHAYKVLDAMEKLVQGEIKQPQATLQIITKYRKVFAMREKAYINRNPFLLCACLPYRKYFATDKSILGDMYRLLRHR